ncbi:MAG: c-type cytochrome [Myxococcales bacterium]|nr:c-type cytochrome [Myxococcales bacterium]
MRIERGPRGRRILKLAPLALSLIAAGCSSSDDTSGVRSGATVLPPEPVSTQPQGAAGSPALTPTATPASSEPVPDAAGGDVVAAPQDDTWCAAQAVFRNACQTCHGEQLAGGAPVPIVTHAHTLAPGVSDPSKTVGELIDLRVHDTAAPMPPLSQPRLSDDQLGALEAWMAAGAPAAAGVCDELDDPGATTVVAEPEWPQDCQERYEIRAHQNGGPYIVPAGSELNIDVTVAVPWAGGGRGPVQALAIKPLTANARVVHHWILYAGVGEFITSWSPGKPMETFPEGVGVHMPSEGNFRLNMHYYNVGNDQDEPDESGLEVCITRDPRPYTATTYMFSGPATVPPGGRVDNVSTCDVVADEPVHIITSSPHMHSYGVASKLEILRADGTVEVLEDGPFNWEDQHVTPVDAVVNNGDRVRLTCSYENTTDQTIRFGSSSEDEMCFNFARYYPMDAFNCAGGSFF